MYRACVQLLKMYVNTHTCYEGRSESTVQKVVCPAVMKDCPISRIQNLKYRPPSMVQPMNVDLAEQSDVVSTCTTHEKQNKHIHVYNTHVYVYIYIYTQRQSFTSLYALQIK